MENPNESHLILRKYMYQNMQTKTRQAVHSWDFDLIEVAPEMYRYWSQKRHISFTNKVYHVRSKYVF